MLSNKKGTHIGKVLSFVIFVIFIFYIYAIIQPAIKTDKNKQSLLDYLKIELNENLSTKIKVMTVSLDNSISGNCIELKDFINFTDNNITLLAKNITGKILGSSVSSDKKNLFIQRGVNEEFLKKLRSSFDLNIYEVKVWTALLSRGVAAAGELADISGVPRSRSYDVLESLEKLVLKFQPEELAIETQFVKKNVQVALKLGMARGVSLLAASINNLEIFEYAPKKAKLAVVGNGSASKFQVQKMVQVLLNLKSIPEPEDAADAMAIAICHAHNIRLNQGIIKCMNISKVN